ncbi:MAG: aminopeptidase P family protein [Lentisphaerae bacterium]|nr:aminopeptidase P family protein [Lentisphaerota bacterium]
MAVTIPKAEYFERVSKLQAGMKEAGFDAVLVHGMESDCGSVRYFSDFWPTFEAAAVLVPVTGEAMLLVGPESGLYAAGRSMLPKIEMMLEYRESADPEYPGLKVASFQDVFKKAMGSNPLRKLGLISYSITPIHIWKSLRSNFPDAEIVPADFLIRELRTYKSDAEIACMRKAYEIAELAVDAILAEIKPGMTELQVIGIAQRELYKHGAEYEGHSLYAFCGVNTCNAISRPTHNLIVPNEVIQLNIGARVCGYTSSVGLPISIGPLPADKRRLVEFGLKAHFKTFELLKGGKKSGDVVREYMDWVKSQGFDKYMLYGPCHSIGMMEVEYPWLESTSTYTLKKNMTYQVDTFFYDGNRFGLRWENGARITDDGVEMMSSKHAKYTELPL